MRIIKFRGKSLNTKMWVYGDLNHRGKRTFIEYEVDCKTISQFIGKQIKKVQKFTNMTLLVLMVNIPNWLNT